MNDPQSRDELRAQLRTELQRRGLPRAYINRLVEELDDHFSDLADGLLSSERNHDMSAARMPDFRINDLDERMGSPTELAIFAADQYHARSFFGRHPFLTFLLGPLPLLVLTWFAFGFSLLGIVYALNGVGYVLELVFGPIPSLAPEDHPWVEAMIMVAVSWILIVLPPLTTAWLLSRTAARNALNWRWPAVGCSLVALVAALFRFSYRLKPPGGHGMVMLGLDAMGKSPGWILLRLLMKFAVALGIGLALVWRERSRGDGEISDNPATIPTMPAA
jgi:hypothetical protein